MILLEQKLIAQTPNSTASVLLNGDKWLSFIIEDGYRKVKEKGITRIPGGRFEIVAQREGKFYERYKAAYGHTWVPHLKNVPGFSAILIHILNFVHETDGCLGPNTTLGFDPRKNVYLGGGSAHAYKQLYNFLDQYIEKETIMIDITR